MADGLQARYLEGVGLWIDRNLPAAVDVLSSVVGDHGPGEDGWSHSAARALAQIALESDDPKAEWHLRKLQGTGVGDAQTLALRGRRWFQVGNEEAALAEIHGAALRLAGDQSVDVGSLMNGAIALIWCAEVLVEMGYADDAMALSTRARARMEAANVDDKALKSGLGMVEASAARLVGDLETARWFLTQVDTSLSADLPIQVTREEARIATLYGQTSEATDLYERSLELARQSGYSFLFRSITEEVEVGPPRLRTDRAPVGQWDPRAMENVPEEHQPYAVVIRLRLDDETDVLGFEDRIIALLDDRPALGHVDGTGTDGEVWELFLDGDDPEALWDAVHPLLERGSLWRRAEVTKRSGSGSHRFRPGPPR